MSETTIEASNHHAVFEHAKRREWGLGVIAWEDGNKRGYVFENGQLRILAEQFYPLMREVDRPQDEVEALFVALRPEIDAARREAGVALRAARPQSASAMSIDDQIKVFHEEYAEGFLDPRWIRTYRSAGSGKRSERLRDAVVARARGELSANELGALAANHDLVAISQRALGLARQSGLVSPSDLGAIAGDRPDALRDLALPLLELLHSQSGYASRLDRFVGTFQRAFGRAPGWTLVTVLPALVHPDEHAVVHPTSIREQAKWMAPQLVLPKTPSAAAYARCLSMVRLVSTRLRESGEQPRDLLDVHDFIRATTRPAAKQLLGELRRSEAARALSRSGSDRASESTGT